MSKSALGFGGGGAGCEGCGFDVVLRIASSFALDGDMFALILEGERGISGDTALEAGAILSSC